MKQFQFIILTIFLGQISFAQASKPIIDSAAINHWVQMECNGTEAISPDGQYFTYRVQNQPLGHSTLVIKAVSRSWKQEYIDAQRVLFTAGGEFVFKSQDTLYFLSLGKSISRYLAGIRAYKECGTGSKSARVHWLAYQLKTRNDELVLLNLLDGRERRYGSVMSYSFGGEGRYLLLQTGQDKETALEWVELPDGKPKAIYSATGAMVNAVMDGSGRQVAFTVQESKGEHPSTMLWYWKAGMVRSVLKAGDGSPGMEPGTNLLPGTYFSPDGRYLFCTLERAELRKVNPGMVAVDVWSYRDTMIQSWQLLNRSAAVGLTQQYGVSFSTETAIPQSVRLRGAYEQYASAPPVKGDYIVVVNQVRGDRFWLGLDSNWLVSLKDGSRRYLVSGPMGFKFSPGGRYLLYYDPQQAQYISYELATGNRTAISATMPAGYLKRTRENHGAGKLPAWTISSSIVGVLGWLGEDEGVLVYDDYDIWQLDLAGKKAVFNITNGYGRRQGIKFRLPGTSATADHVLSARDKLLLSAFDLETKYNGFFRVGLNGGVDPELLSMAPKTYYHSTVGMLYTASFAINFAPLKALDGEVWVVRRESYDEVPNYFATKDFKQYTAITDLQPQKGYNWLQAELIHWQQLDGTRGQGVLYKPENFDPARKYPVLINYYEQFSFRLYESPVPAYTGSAYINIPWFVSRGYLVLTPDIYFEGDKKSGPGAYNSIVSAGQYLSTLPFVDGRRMGIAGHSFAGGLTNYLVTHTDLFAAAFVGAGVSDYVSAGLQLDARLGSSSLGAVEKEYTLWQKPELYTEPSPVMHVDKVKTPVLLFHCKPDGGVPFEQAVEMFVALRRLEKKAWLLQYDKGSHLVYGKEAEDLTMRITQFFDHYLKGAPAPVWMTQGIPARLKGIEDGLALDPNRKCGKDCPVCNKKLN